jgi:toxin ParE1/3/4
MKVRFTREAEADLEGIGDKIAERNPVRATTYVRELRERCLSVGDFPHAWPPRPQWGESVRITVHGNYVIVHRVRDEMVQIPASCTALAISMYCSRKSRCLRNSAEAVSGTAAPTQSSWRRMNSALTADGAQAASSAASIASPSRPLAIGAGASSSIPSACM